jgi:radical SAM protein with 4Fe4S-binding SPASM domain
VFPAVSGRGAAGGAKPPELPRASGASECSRTERGEGGPASERVGGAGGAKPPELPRASGASECSRTERGEGVPASERVGGPGGAKPPGQEFVRPYVISWNLTYRCNLACEHCYLDAGGAPQVGTENFADRSELGTDECFRVIDEIAAFAPECLTILTGGEPLLRRDILEIVRRAAERELWVVVGTNGVRITENLSRHLAEAGARGLSLSLDALDPDRHDRFRKVRGAWRNTVEGAQILNRTGLPFIVQTTAGSHNLSELEAIADFAYDRLAAKVWNLYFLVPTGRGQFVSDMTPAQYDEVLAALYRIQRKYNRRMLVNAKCAPHFIKTVLENAGDEALSDSGLPGIRTYSGGAGGCPAGTHYMGIRPNGDVTPCPYLPVFAGTVRTAGLADLWTSSDLFVDVRRRTSLGGRCGACELNGHCGGCRARAYGMTGDLMAEDPLCTHTPGKFVESPLLAILGAARPGASDVPSGRLRAGRPERSGEGTAPASGGVGGGAGVPPAGLLIEYGPESPTTIGWDDAAAERMKRIPAFVRGMVVRAVEESCRRNGIGRVTVEELERIRARMPTPKLFR